MKSIVHFIFLLLVCEICHSQNLVPNGDFESYSSCPDYQSQIDSALFWINPSIGGMTTAGSPDYFNQCTNYSVIDVPNNQLGFQPAHSGVAYSGIYIWTPGANIREYIETSLTSPLSANTNYHFQMFVNLGNINQRTTNDISVYFSDTAITGVTNYYPLPVNPQINNTSGSNFDTLNWTLVTGNYLAHGGENYLIIGNFKYNAAVNTVVINSLGTLDAIYCLIDDVSLTMATSINDLNPDHSISIYPNPAKDKIKINCDDNQGQKNGIVTIYNTLGKLVFQNKYDVNETIDISSLESGLFFIELTSSNQFLKGKFVKE